MRKILLSILSIFFIISYLNFSEQNEELLKNYPHKDSAIRATVLGTPKKDWFKFKNPRGPQVRVVEPKKEVPEILRQWKNYEYGVWKQKEKAPLVIIISGTGGTYNGSYTLYLANIFYERGYNVITFSSTSTLPYIVSQSKNSYTGYFPDDIKELYNIMSMTVQNEKSEGMQISDTYISGYSLGGFQSLLIHELDSRMNRLKIKKSLLLNTPTDILESSKILDLYLSKNGIYDAKTLEKYFDKIFKKFLFDDTIKLSNINDVNIEEIFRKINVENKDFEVLVGLLFRFYSANMTFAGEAYEGGGDRILQGDKVPKRFDSITKYFMEGLSVSFEEYSEDILYPYLKKTKYPNLTYDEFIKSFSIKRIEPFIKGNKNIIYVTSKDDILMSKDDFKYVENTFENKIFLPYGGHMGALWDKEVSKLLVDTLEEGVKNDK